MTTTQLKTPTLGWLKVTLAVLVGMTLISLGAGGTRAQNSSSTLYVPLIGLTSVPDPLALPTGAGNVTYSYAVKNFLNEVPLTNVKVVDDKCAPITFVTGDDNHDNQLDASETWRYKCSTQLATTTQSIATATGTANNITASHKAYATVVVGSNNPPPLISIVNVTKVAYPLSLPAGGGDIAFTYKVNNPGVVPLSDVAVTDNKCSNVSGKLGDTNGNNLLDLNEVWIYTCSSHLTETTTNTVNVTAFANGLKAIGDATITVKVDIPALPDAGTNPNLKYIVWEVLTAVLAALIIVLVLIRRNKFGRSLANTKFFDKP